MLSLGKLPWRNLKGYAGRTVSLILFSALMAASVFGGILMIGGIRGSLETVRSRLGADIMITPESAANEFDAQTVLIQADPGYFYMDREKLEEIRRVEGVLEASPQLFLASARAGCCSTRVQMIAYEPETDFTVTPWISASSFERNPGFMDVIIGSSVDWSSAADNGTIRFYDVDCHVAGQFAPTGSSLDSAVYMDFDTCRVLIDACREKGMFKYEDLDADAAISSVMVRTEKGYDIAEVADRIRESVAGVRVATVANMVSGIAESLDGIGRTARVLVAVFYLLGAVMTVLLFTLMMNERAREFASLRAMGAGKGLLSGIVAGEALIVVLLGGAAGILVCALILYPFSGLIAQALGSGLVLPGAAGAALAAAAALLALLPAAAASAAITVKKISRMDAGLILREGE